MHKTSVGRTGDRASAQNLVPEKTRRWASGVVRKWGRTDLTGF